MFLGLGYPGSIFTSYTMLDLFYCKELCKYEPEDWTNSMLKLQHFQPVYNGLTLFHQYSLDYRALALIFDEIKRYDPEEEDEILKENTFKELLFQVIYPNDYIGTPFDLAVKSTSPKLIEIQLQMLMTMPQYRLSQFIKKHFQFLFLLALPSFEDYLE